MVKVRIMYWKEIPVQVQAVDDDGTASVPLEERFQQGADAISMFDGSAGTDDYLMAWEWGDYSEVEGTARDAAARTAARYNDGFPKDFVAQVTDMERSGNRTPSAGSIDHWIVDQPDEDRSR